MRSAPVTLCLSLTFFALWSRSALADQAPASRPSTTQASVVQHLSSGWTFEFAPGWQKPAGYSKAGVEKAWDSQGISHRVPPCANPDSVNCPTLTWWGIKFDPKDKLEDRVKEFAAGMGTADRLQMEQPTDITIDGRPGKRVEVTYTRTVPFAPAGRGEARMHAVLFMVRKDDQENGAWFEAKEKTFSQYLKSVDSIVSSARISKRGS